MSQAERTKELTNWYVLELQKRIPGTRAFRMNIGGAYPIAMISRVMRALMDGDWVEAASILRKSRPVMFGGMAGLPDVCGILPDGRWVGVEIKSAEDGQRDAQKVCEKVFRDRTAIYVVARDESAMDEVMRQWDGGRR